MTTASDDNPAPLPPSSGETPPAVPSPPEPVPHSPDPVPAGATPSISSISSTPSEPTERSAAPDAPESKPSPPPSRPRPLADFGTVIWIALWSATLALGVATGSSVWERIESRAAERAILLLPASETSETDRERWLASLLEKNSVASGEWLSPTTLVQRVSTSVPADLWAQLFSDDDAWLPWLLQLRPVDPLHSSAELEATLEAFHADPRFRLVLYDQPALTRDAEIWRHVRTGTFLFAGLMMTLGLLALLLSPGLTRYPIEAPFGGLLAVILAAAAGYALQRFGAPLDRNQYLRSLATAFGLAALVGPMLKGRLTQVIRRRGE